MCPILSSILSSLHNVHQACCPAQKSTGGVRGTLCSEACGLRLEEAHRGRAGDHTYSFVYAMGPPPRLPWGCLVAGAAVLHLEQSVQKVAWPCVLAVTWHPPGTSFMLSAQPRHAVGCSLVSCTAARLAKKILSVPPPRAARSSWR